MRRRWKAFDKDTMNREFLRIPKGDRTDLWAAMRAFRDETGIGYVVDSYGDNLYRIKSANRSQGRCLFIAVVERPGEQLLVAVAAYKKETQKVPDAVIRKARERKARYLKE